jgi:hypothetical protein
MDVTGCFQGPARAYRRLARCFSSKLIVSRQALIGNEWRWTAGR